MRYTNKQMTSLRNIRVSEILAEDNFPETETFIDELIKTPPNKTKKLLDTYEENMKPNNMKLH